MYACKKARAPSLLYLFPVHSGPICAPVSLRWRRAALAYYFASTFVHIFIQPWCAELGRKWYTFSALLALRSRRTQRIYPRFSNATTCGIPVVGLNAAQALIAAAALACWLQAALVYGSLKSASGCSSAYSRFMTFCFSTAAALSSQYECA